VVALGGTTALDTLGSQAFTGSPRPTDLSVHFQRCLILLWFLLIPVCFLWAYIEPILLALGQSEDLSRGVQTFLRVLIFGAPGYIGFESLKKYLQCQGLPRVLILSDDNVPPTTRHHGSLYYCPRHHFPNQLGFKHRISASHKPRTLRLTSCSLNRLLVCFLVPHSVHLPLTHTQT
jgi:hypothetical protein